MKNYLIGFYQIEGFGPDSVEVPLTGVGSTDYARLADAVKAKYPGKVLRRVGSHIESRADDDPGYIEAYPGMTLKQLFEQRADGTADLVRKIGRVHFNGIRSDVFLLFVQARGTVSVSVRPLLKSEGVANFQVNISPQRQVDELPSILNDLFGAAGRELNLLIRKPIKK